MIVKGHQQLEATRIDVTRAELREELVRLWAAVFEAELRADLEAERAQMDVAPDPLADEIGD